MPAPHRCGTSPDADEHGRPFSEPSLDDTRLAAGFQDTVVEQRMLEIPLPRVPPERQQRPAHVEVTTDHRVEIGHGAGLLLTAQCQRASVSPPPQ
jgi:hypothetical protein